MVECRNRERGNLGKGFFTEKKKSIFSLKPRETSQNILVMPIFCPWPATGATFQCWIPAGSRAIPQPTAGGSLCGESAAQSLCQGNVSLSGLDGMNLTPFVGVFGGISGKKLSKKFGLCSGEGPSPVFLLCVTPVMA